MIKTKIEWSDSTWSPVTGCYAENKKRLVPMDNIEKVEQ